jgi:SPX domain protein involved in polyphosphate accumulation
MWGTTVDTTGQVTSKSLTMNKKTLSNVVCNDGHNEWVLRVYTRAGDFQVTDHDEAMSSVSHNCGYIRECDLQISKRRNKGIERPTL